MTDASWDTYTPETPRNPWLRGVLLGAGVLVLLAALPIAGMAMSRRNLRDSAWWLVQDLATRLRTDHRAGELYRANPALAEAYGSETAFLAQVRPFREALRPPDAEPPEGPGYRVQAGPSFLRIRWKAGEGAWMEAQVELGTPFGRRAQGEGITRLALGRDPGELRSLARAEAGLRAAESWRRFIALAHDLADPLRQSRLLEANPGLRVRPGRDAFFRQAALRREALLAVPEDPAALPQRASRQRRGPFRHTWEGSFLLKDGGRLSARWEDGRLDWVALD